MTTLLETLTKGASYLEKKGVDSPRLTMELLAAHALKMRRMQLYLDFDKPVDEEQLKLLRDLLKKRGERVPLQHILGDVEFLGRTFISDERALIPRPETEELVDYVLKLDLPKQVKILDLCSGSGVIGLSLKAELGVNASVTLADISPATLSLAKENADKLGVDVELVHSDLFDELEEEYDLIVSNPPYVSTLVTLDTEVRHDPDLALFSGEDGLNHLNKIIPQATRHLSENGILALEIGYDQSDAVKGLLESAFYKEIQFLEDINKIPRFPVARRG